MPVSTIKKAFIIVTFVTFPAFHAPHGNALQAQPLTRFGIRFDPSAGWFSNDVSTVRNDGARPGFSFGLAINRYFAPNYSFSSGIMIQNAGGRLVSSEKTIMDFTNFTAEVSAGSPVVYKIQYLVVPAGIRMQTNQIGYVTVFSDLGIDPKLVIGGKCDIASLGIKGEKANSELKMFNAAYHIAAGIDYAIGGSTSLVFGIRFENNFLDITEDNNSQPSDKTMQRILSFSLGVNF